MDIDFEKILVIWADGNVGFVIPKGKDDGPRITAFLQLFKDVEVNVLDKNPNLTVEELKTEVENIIKVNTRKILSICSVNRAKNRDKLEGWRSVVERCFKKALYKEYNPSTKRGTLTEKEIEHVNSSESVNSEAKDLANTEITEETKTIYSESEFVNVPTLDISTLNVVKPQVDIDTEFAKLLGYDE